MFLSLNTSVFSDKVTNRMKPCLKSEAAYTILLNSWWFCIFLRHQRKSMMIIIFLLITEMCRTGRKTILHVVRLTGTAYFLSLVRNNLQPTPKPENTHHRKYLHPLRTWTWKSPDKHTTNTDWLCSRNCSVTGGHLVRFGPVFKLILSFSQTTKTPERF